VKTKGNLFITRHFGRIIPFFSLNEKENKNEMEERERRKIMM
jgi:hypothetical protein